MTEKAPFVTTDYIRWEDIDLAGIARYSAYTRFLDIAETDLYRSLGTPLSKLHAQYKLWLPRKVMHIEYFSPAKLDDQVVIVAYFSNIGRTSVTMNVDLFGEDRTTLIAAAHLVLVCVDVELKKLALPPEFRALVERHILTTEEARVAI
ncbi:MAG: acyl-CoA thioesterase [Gemmatimonadaceae bacterium]|nr:acyl-CoA thioesterase [Gemmatimonadaceae bacterium]